MCMKYIEKEFVGIYLKIVIKDNKIIAFYYFF